MVDTEIAYPYNVASTAEIENGEVTDAYFLRTEDALDYANKNPDVVAEVTADQFGDGTREVFAGLDEAVQLLSGLPVTVHARPEGTFFDGGPVMKIRGSYRDFARYETALLGILSQASGFATAAARICAASPYRRGPHVPDSYDVSILSFGSRHVHPALAPVLERSAYIGGVDGYSNVAASSVVPGEPSGTMPHALMLAFGEGNEESAWEAFHRSADDSVPRIVLVDTQTDEVDEAKRACRQLGPEIDGIRLDTTGSRRGDFTHIIREVAYELEVIGRDDVDIYVSGGLQSDDVAELVPYVDGIGVGSAISSADPVDFSLDIVRRSGVDTSKRGKLPGVKDVEDYECVIDDGEVTYVPDVDTARQRVLQVINDD